MSTTEILLLIVAIGLLILSFVLVDKDSRKKGNEYKPELTKDEIEQLKVQMQTIIEDAVTNSVIDADDKMSRISNEKIMAVNDFSVQLLEKMEQNNKEVVFLYDMLCKKEEDIKVTFSKMDAIRRENKEFLEKITSLMNNRKKGEPSTQQRVNTQMQMMDTEALVESGDITGQNTQKDQTKEGNPSELDDKIVFLEETVTTKELEEKRRAEIIELHLQKKSIRDISRQLGIGQGEVKLIIDLYAQKN